MKFYYGSISPNSRRSLATAYELKYELELLPLTSLEAFEDPEFLKKNPNGLVPVLEDGSFVLWESNAIMQYLADKKGETALYTKDYKVRADISRWQYWAIAHFDAACGILLWEHSFKQFLAGGGDPDPAEVKRGLAEFREVAGILDQHLRAQKYLVGDHLTLADYSVASFLMYSEESKLPMKEFPNIVKWFERISASEGWKKSGLVITGLPVAGVA